jgi:pyruvate/2-oxoglutarate dehydrogenase complex dihydrolipoamide acyltransferase (E2) component
VNSLSTDPTSLVDILMPKMGTSIEEGTVIAWSKRVGERIAADETLCEISTDKVDTECPSPATGAIAEILVAAGDTVAVGSVIARIAVDASAQSATEAPLAPDGPEAPTTAETTAPPAPRNAPHTSAEPQRNGQRYSPLVRRIATANGLDLSLVQGTGRGSRVTKQDVLAHLADLDQHEPGGDRPLHSDSPYRPDPSPAASVTARPAPPEFGGVAEPLTRMRKSIGKAMRHSLDTAATAHTIVECDMSTIERRRRELGLTALPLIARATIDTLREYPVLNATLDADAIILYDRVHLGIAVSLGDEGLMVPVIHDAQELSAEGLSNRIKDIASRARDKQLSLDEMQNATFTITNPGAFGALIATPIIDVPQIAILDVEAIVRRPVVITDGDGNEGIAIRPMGNLILGWDHRAIDGVYAARFLTALRLRLEASPSMGHPTISRGYKNQA